MSAAAIDYEKLTCKELVELCKERSIKGYSKKTKLALIDLLNGEDDVAELTATLDGTHIKDAHDEEAERMAALNDMITRIHETIKANPDARIVLLKQKEVIQWLFGDLSFLPAIEKKNKTADEAQYKILEDKWGQETLKLRRPDLRLDKQWTNKFGEHLVEEFYILQGKEITKPVKKDHYQPDSEIDEAIIEAKAGTFFTSGTAGEKILGCPFKYAEVPDLYSKPLRIVCMGGAEKVCREQYGNLDGPKCTPQKKRFLDFFKANHIEYVAASELLTTFS